MRVRVRRMAEDLVWHAGLDNASGLHHRDPIAHTSDNRQIVADQHDGQGERTVEICQQINDLSLQGDVESGDRLIGDQQCWLGRQGARDADALALAPGNLVRITTQERRVQRNLGHQRFELVSPVASRDAACSERLR